MLTVTNTPNWAGITISGDYYDFQQLVDAFHEITIDEFTENKKEIPYIEMSDRVLGLCYEIRHASQGDRSIKIVESGLPHVVELAEEGKFPKENLYYTCNYYYPEMFYLMLALDELIKLRISKVTKAKFIYEQALYPLASWDETIAALRGFQAAFRKNMASTLARASMTRWMNLMKDSRGIVHMATQFLDQLNIQYLNMPKEKREKWLLSLTKSICQYPMDKDYQKLQFSLEAAAQEYSCSISELSLSDMDYPEEIHW